MRILAAMSDLLRPLILWGATGQAKVLGEFLAAAGFVAVAVFDNDLSVQSSPLPGVPLRHGREEFEIWLQTWSGSKPCAIAAIGGARGQARLDFHTLFASCGLVVPTLLHPRSYVAGSAAVGEGSQVLGHAVVAADAVLGRACIVNTSASVDHECRLADGVHIGPGATLAGCVSVGQCAFIGAGAVVLPRVSIGAGAIVGAGAVVTRDVAAGMVVYGNPAKAVRVVENQ
jgi:sugar O-acyltransferase (sialic acid O-acetyltransferase NeuD family)